jgi:DNA-binding NtrC family response regulator
VRELSHVIERAALSGPVLDVEHLSLSTPAAALDSPPAPATTNGGATLPPPGVDLDQWERSIIEQALREAEGNQTRAAQRLGISRDTLRYRLKKHGIQG